MVFIYSDIDEKFKKRGRHERYQGPLQDFVEKPYVPDFNVSCCVEDKAWDISVRSRHSVSMSMR